MKYLKFIYLLKTNLFFCIFLSVLFLTKNYYDSFQLAKSAGFLFFLLFFLIITVFTDKQETEITPSLFFYFLFIFYIIICVLVSKFYIPSYSSVVLLTPLAFIIPLFLKIDFKKFLFFINLFVFISCIYGIFQYLSGQIRPFAFFGNPIFFAEFLSALLPFIFISFYFFSKNSLFFSFNILLALLTLTLCSSRGPLISFLGSFFILFFILFKTDFIKFNKTFLFHIVFCLFFLFFIFFIPNFGNTIKYNIERISDLFSKKSSAVKTRILTANIALISANKNFLFGNGPGSFKYYYQKYQSDILKTKKEFNFINTSYVHNDYLQLLSEFGFIGLFLFLFFVFSLFYSYDRAFPFMQDKNFIFATACISSLFSILLESFFNFPLFIFPAALLFYIISGFLYSITKDFFTFYFLKIKSFILNILFLFFILLILFTKPFDFISNFYLNYGLNLTLKYLPKDRDYLSKAIKLNPYNFLNYFFMGNAFASIKKYEDAIYYYKKCLETYPFSSDILFNIGVMFRALKNYDKAEEYLKKAIDLYPDFADARFHLGKIYQNTNRQELANSEFAIVNRLNPFLFDKEFSKSVIFFTETSYEINYNIDK